MMNVKVSGAIADNALLGVTNAFQLEGLHSLADLVIRIKSPSDQEFVPKVSQISSSECRVEWTPYELGTYIIQAYYGEQLVKGTPLKIKIYDPSRVQVYNITDGLVLKPNVFCVDASQSGEGSLEIGISCNGHYIPNQVKPIGNSKFEVCFLPQVASTHLVNINFNAEPVKGA